MQKGAQECILNPMHVSHSRRFAIHNRGLTQQDSSQRRPSATCHYSHHSHWSACAVVLSTRYTPVSAAPTRTLLGGFGGFANQYAKKARHPEEGAQNQAARTRQVALQVGLNGARVQRHCQDVALRPEVTGQRRFDYSDSTMPESFIALDEALPSLSPL